MDGQRRVGGVASTGGPRARASLRENPIYTTEESLALNGAQITGYVPRILLYGTSEYWEAAHEKAHEKEHENGGPNDNEGAYLVFIVLLFALENIADIFKDQIVTGRAQAKGNPERWLCHHGLPPT